MQALLGIHAHGMTYDRTMLVRVCMLCFSDLCRLMISLELGGLPCTALAQALHASKDRGKSLPKGVHHDLAAAPCDREPQTLHANKLHDVMLKTKLDAGWLIEQQRQKLGRGPDTQQSSSQEKTRS